MLIAIVAIFFLIFISALDWKKSVVFVLVFIILEGVARKWILPQASNLIYFVKDLVLIGAYIKYFLIEGKKIKKHNINIFIYLLAIWSFVQAFNPSLGSYIVGLFGLKTYLLYIPIFWILPDLFTSKIDLYKFIRNYSLLVIPVCLLAVAQFFSPPSSPLNVYASGVDVVATFGVGKEQIVRVSGTFSYITGFGTYLSVSLALLIPLLTLRQSRIWYCLTIIELLLVLGTSFMTGSRAVVLYEALFLISYIFILSLTHLNQAPRIIKKFIIPTIVAAMVVPTYFSKSINLLSQRSTSNSAEGTARIWRPFAEAASGINYIIQSKQIDSYGTGATHQATSFLRKLLDLPQGEPMPLLEVEPPRVAAEIGVIGFISWYLIRISLIIYLLLTLIKLRDPFLYQLALSAFLFHALQITIPVIFNPYMGIYYWFFAGFILLLPALEKREQETF
ncbi:hypothetical protein [Nostoc sp. UHCC 0251]|uniref:hypothetical protein n=1 Tax=Nostoc sp. UHCC 0251 TaxID=3110240 RepID=UPI002B215611|nr:hypothetical protein [Nostoc sp. UHCC 0251]MEA5626092.1 hypothetical protein [Nostoc sp. UHCC 0251]